MSVLFTGNWVLTAIMAVLLIMSALSWAIIFIKWTFFNRVRAENRHFYYFFRQDQPFANIYNLSQKLGDSTLARMFDETFREINSFRQSLDKEKPPPDARERLLASLSRKLESVYNKQNLVLESRLPVLATVSASAPFLGLLGTVLGIMDAFQNIGMMGVTSLAVVAPGLSVALITTAAGLLAAIPALIAYNMYRSRIRILDVEMRNFALEITGRFEKVL